MKPVLLLLLFIVPLNAQAAIRITEVMSNSSHATLNADGDWFEITNTGSTAVNMLGYSFDDESAIAGASGAFPSYSLQPGASMIVLQATADTAFRGVWALDSGIRILTSELVGFPGLSGGGDAVYLFNPSGTIVDSYVFGEATEGVSFVRFKNGNSVPGGLSVLGLYGSFESLDDPDDLGSPGLAVDPPSSPLTPYFREPFATAVLAGGNLGNLAYRIEAIDPNPEDSLTLTMVPATAPAWLGFNDLGGGSGQFTGSPSAADLGSYDISVTVTDSSGLSATRLFRIDVLPASSPVILNEFNAVQSGNFLDGGTETDVGAPADPFFGRIEGNGGAWAEFVVTQTTDFRGWTLEILSTTQTRRLKLSQHPSLASIPAGTLLSFSEGRRFLPTVFNRNSQLNTNGYTHSHIWMHDPIVIDQAASVHPLEAAISNDDTRFIWYDPTGAVAYGPAGESIALRDTDLNGVGDDLVTVGGTEVFRLETTPTSSVHPLVLDYDDVGTSSFGSPNRWTSDVDPLVEVTQDFSAYVAASTPPKFGPVSTIYATNGAYQAEARFTSGAAISAVTKPDFLNHFAFGDTLVLSSNRELLPSDVGTYEVCFVANNGQPTNNLTYLVYTLEVLHPSPEVVLNEYNAVDSLNFLNGGTATDDIDGAPAAFDTYFGRVAGNGGDWFELVVVGDGTAGYADLSGWTIEVGELMPSGLFRMQTTIELTDVSTWSAVPHGTLLTFSEQDSLSGGLDTELYRVNELASSGYVWSHVFLGASELITVSPLPNIRVNSNNTAFLIRDATGLAVFGPAGEGVAPLEGIGDTEIFELENDPSPQITPIRATTSTALGYDDGDSESTFGSPNTFTPIGSTIPRSQDFSPFIQGRFEAFMVGAGLPGVSAEADSDADGSDNLEEYLYGGNPADPAALPFGGAESGTLSARFDVRVDDPAYTPVAERSADLSTWVNDQLTVQDEPSPLGPDFVRRRIQYDGDAPKMFFRMRFNPGG